MMKQDARRPLLMAALAAALLGPAVRVPAQSIPLLPEDTPSDVVQLGLGPWDGQWVIESSVRGGVEVTTYFCSHELARQCVGMLYVRAEPAICEAGCTGSECSGACQGTAEDHRKDVALDCENDSDCPMTESDSTCRRAKSDAADAATRSCADRGGAGCACYSQAQVTSFSAHCAEGLLGNYCKYSCSAEARGDCKAGWTPEPTH